MRNKSVAVLDIRSSEITSVVSERGVNNTFIIKSKYTCAYDGYAEGEFLDADSFISAVTEVLKSTVSAFGKIRTFYVGVPGEFIKLVNCDKVLSFQSARRITDADCAYLAEKSAPPDTDDYKTIRHSCLYYVLSDKRKVINPVGAVSDSLQGKFCFYQCDKSFIALLLEAFRKFGGIKDIKLIPEVYAEAMYLVEPEKRDESAVLVDIGYISSSYSVICGNGLAFSESFSVGIGHIAVYLMTELEIPFEVAYAFLEKVNLNAKEKPGIFIEYLQDGKNYRFSTATLRDLVREGLDGLCEALEECVQSYSGRIADNKPVNITGEGVKVVKGTADHLSDRLAKSVEIVSPKIPFYDKPHFGPLISLIDTALKDSQSKSVFKKFFKV